MKKGRKEYLVIGSNNFWYTATGSLADAKAEAADILAGNGSYGDEESGHQPNTPETIYIYQAFQVDRIEREDDEEEDDSDGGI